MPFGRNPLMLGGHHIGISAVSRNFLTFDGNASRGTFTAQSLTTGDAISVGVETTLAGVAQTLFHAASSPLQVRIDATNNLDLTGCTITMDGVGVSDGTSMAAYQDGLLHVMVVTLTGSYQVDTVGSNVTPGEFWRGVIANLNINDSVGWDISNGSTASEEASIGSGTLTYHNVSAGDWEEFTQDEAGDWLGVEMQELDYTEALGSWVAYGTNAISYDAAEGGVKCIYVDNGSGMYVYVRDNYDLISDLTVGYKYRYTAQCKVNNGGSVQIKWNPPWKVMLLSESESWEAVTHDVIATHEAATVINLDSMGAGEIFYIKAVSLKRFLEVA